MSVYFRGKKKITQCDYDCDGIIKVYIIIIMLSAIAMVPYYATQKVMGYAQFWPLGNQCAVAGVRLVMRSSRPHRTPQLNWTLQRQEPACRRWHSRSWGPRFPGYSREGASAGICGETRRGGRGVGCGWQVWRLQAGRGVVRWEETPESSAERGWLGDGLAVELETAGRLHACTCIHVVLASYLRYIPIMGLQNWKLAEYI